MSDLWDLTPEEAQAFEREFEMQDEQNMFQQSVSQRPVYEASQQPERWGDIDTAQSLNRPHVDHPGRPSDRVIQGHRHSDELPEADHSSGRRTDSQMYSLKNKLSSVSANVLERVLGRLPSSESQQTRINETLPVSSQSYEDSQLMGRSPPPQGSIYVSDDSDHDARDRRYRDADARHIQKEYDKFEREIRDSYDLDRREHDIEVRSRSHDQDGHPLGQRPHSIASQNIINQWPMEAQASGPRSQVSAILPHNAPGRGTNSSAQATTMVNPTNHPHHDKNTPGGRGIYHGDQFVDPNITANGREAIPGQTWVEQQRSGLQPMKGLLGTHPTGQTRLEQQHSGLKPKKGLLDTPPTDQTWLEQQHSGQQPRQGLLDTPPTGQKLVEQQHSGQQPSKGLLDTPPAPKRRGRCMFFTVNKCLKGDKCLFSHDLKPTKRPGVCKHYLHSRCFRANSCMFMHSEFPCKFYHIGGNCNKTEKCKFSHDPLTAETRQLLEQSLDGKEDGWKEHKDNAKPGFQGVPPSSTPGAPSLFDMKGFPESDTFRPSPGDTRTINIRKTSETDVVGFRLEQGAQGGVVIVHVIDNSLAANNGIVAGDQILEFCSINFRTVSKELAKRLMRSSTSGFDTMEMVVQFNPDNKPVQGKPVHGKPVQDMPVQDMPVHGRSVDMPVHNRPVQDIPVNGRSVQDMPDHSRPVHGRPVQDKQVYGRSVQDVPVHARPAQDKQVYGRPVQDMPVHGRPAQDKQVYGRPVQDMPVQSKAIHDKPVQSRAVQDKPVYGRPVQDKEVHNRQVQNKAVHGRPVQDKPVQGRPVPDKPVTANGPWKCVCGNVNPSVIVNCLNCGEVKSMQEPAKPAVKGQNARSLLKNNPDVSRGPTSTIGRVLREMRALGHPSLLPPQPDGLLPLQPVQPQPAQTVWPPQSEAFWPVQPEAVLLPPAATVWPPQPDTLFPRQPAALQPQPAATVWPPQPNSLLPLQPEALQPQPAQTVQPPQPGIFWPVQPKVSQPPPAQTVWPPRPDGLLPLQPEALQPQPAQTVRPPLPEIFWPVQPKVAQPPPAKTVWPPQPDGLLPLQPEALQPQPAQTVRPPLPEIFWPVQPKAAQPPPAKTVWNLPPPRPLKAFQPPLHGEFRPRLPAVITPAASIALMPPSSEALTLLPHRPSLPNPRPIRPLLPCPRPVLPIHHRVRQTVRKWECANTVCRTINDFEASHCKNCSTYAKAPGTKSVTFMPWQCANLACLIMNDPVQTICSKCSCPMELSEDRDPPKVDVDPNWENMLRNRRKRHQLPAPKHLASLMGIKIDDNIVKQRRLIDINLSDKESNTNIGVLETNKPVTKHPLFSSWKCANLACGTMNDPEQITCMTCSRPRAAPGKSTPDAKSHGHPDSLKDQMLKKAKRKLQLQLEENAKSRKLQGVTVFPSPAKMDWEPANKRGRWDKEPDTASTANKISSMDVRDADSTKRYQSGDTQAKDSPDDDRIVTASLTTPENMTAEEWQLYEVQLEAQKLMDKEVQQQSVALPAADMAARLKTSQLNLSDLMRTYPMGIQASVELIDLTNKIVEFSQNEHGAQFIKEKLIDASAFMKNVVFKEVFPVAQTLVRHRFGYLVIHKLLEVGSMQQKLALVRCLTPHMYELSLNERKSQIILTALSHVPPNIKLKLIHGLDGHVLECMKNQYGSHIIQKALECIDTKGLQFIIDAIKDQVVNLSTDALGCKVILSIIQHCIAEQKLTILTPIFTHFDKVVCDENGSYVIQALLKYGNKEERENILDRICTSLSNVAKDKFSNVLNVGNNVHACKVIQNIIQYGSAEPKGKIIALINQSFNTFVCDDNGIRIIQRAVEYGGKEHKSEIINKILFSLGTLSKDKRASIMRWLKLSHLATHIDKFSQNEHGARHITEKLPDATSIEKSMVFIEVLAASQSLIVHDFGHCVVQKLFEVLSGHEKASLACCFWGHMYELSFNEHASQIIQNSLSSISPTTQSHLVRELDGHVMECIKNQYAVDVVCRVLECVHSKHLQFIFDAIKDQILELSTDVYGYKVIQSAIQSWTQWSDEQRLAIFTPIFKHFYKVIRNEYGSCVMEAMFKYGGHVERGTIILKTCYNLIVFKSGKCSKILSLYTDVHACKVIRSIIQYGTAAQKTKVIAKINLHFNKLVYKENGSFLICSGIEYGSDEDRTMTINIIMYHQYAKLLKLSTHVHACKVMQSIIQYCTTENIVSIISRINQLFTELVCNENGSHIIQAMLKYGNKEQVIKRIRDNLASLRKDKLANASHLSMDYRRTGLATLRLNDLTNYIAEFSQFQLGARFIQEKLIIATPVVKSAVFTEIQVSAHALITHPFGHTVVQTFFKVGSMEDKLALALCLCGHVFELSLDEHASHVIRNSLILIPLAMQLELIREFDGHVLECIKNQHASQIIQKALACIHSRHLQFIVDAIKDQVLDVSTDVHAHKVIQSVIQYCTHDQKAPVIAEIKQHFDKLVCHENGSHVIQCVLELGSKEEKLHIVQQIMDNLDTLSKDKYAKILTASLTPPTGIATEDRQLSEVQTEEELMAEELLHDKVELKFEKASALKTSQTKSLQEKLESATPVVRDKIFNKVLGSVQTLIVHHSGHSVVQEFFEIGSTTEKESLARCLSGHMYKLSLHEHASQVIQNSLRYISKTMQIELIREFDGHVLECIKNQYATQIIQKALQYMDPEQLQFIIDAIKDQVFDVCTDAHGCEVIMCMMHYSNAEQKAAIFLEIEQQFEQLACDQNGSGFIKSMIECGRIEDKHKVIHKIEEHFDKLVCSEHGSCIIQSVLVHGQKDDKSEIIKKIMDNKDTLSKDEFAMKAVETCGEHVHTDELAGDLKALHGQ